MSSNTVRRGDRGLGKTASGGNAGSFAPHERESAAAPPVSDGSLSPGEVLTVEFSADAVAERLDGAYERSENPGWKLLDDGREVQTVYFTATREYVRDQVVVFDDRGDVIRVDARYDGDDGRPRWEHDEEERQKLQSHVRMARLRAMGVDPDGKASDSGYSGRKFVGAKAEPGAYRKKRDIAADIRKDVKRAVEFGALPEDVEVRVRTRSGGSGAIDVNVTVPHGTYHPPTPNFAEQKDLEYWQREQGRRQSIETQGIGQVLGSIANQWNVDDSDPMTDYFSTRYYAFVNISERPESESITPP